MSPFIRPSLSAEDCADILRAHAKRLSDTLWSLDSARSMLRKAQAGYRNATETGDGVWDLETYQRRVENATISAGRLIAEMRLAAIPVDVAPYQRLADQATAPIRQPHGDEWVAVD